jgi:hypothetical protein
MTASHPRRIKSSRYGMWLVQITLPSLDMHLPPLLHHSCEDAEKSFCQINTGGLLPLWHDFCYEDGGSIFLRNIVTDLPDYTAT